MHMLGNSEREEERKREEGSFTHALLGLLTMMMQLLLVRQHRRRQGAAVHRQGKRGKSSLVAIAADTVRNCAIFLDLDSQRSLG